MGNRAVITNRDKKIGIYIHWNGGRDSIEGFLEAARKLGYRKPDEDSPYSMARLAGLICLFFGMDKDCSVGIGSLDNLDTDNGDNGVYVIGDDWKVVERYGSGAGEEAKENPDAEPYDKELSMGIAASLLEKVRTVSLTS